MHFKYSRILYLIIFPAFILCQSACSYPEGPKLTIKSKKSRLTGTWDVHSIDGIEAEPHSYTYTFNKDGTGEVAALGNSNELTWVWQDNKASLTVVIDNDIFDYAIMRLASDEMIWIDESAIEWILKKSD